MRVEMTPVREKSPPVAKGRSPDGRAARAGPGVCRGLPRSARETTESRSDRRPPPAPSAPPRRHKRSRWPPRRWRVASRLRAAPLAARALADRHCYSTARRRRSSPLQMSKVKSLGGRLRLPRLSGRAPSGAGGTRGLVPHETQSQSESSLSCPVPSRAVG